MQFKSMLLGLCAGLPLVVCAHAVDISGLAGVGYGRVTGGVNEYGGDGAALFSFGNSGFQAQISGGDTHAQTKSISADSAHISADIFWRDPKGSFGTTLSYHRISAGISAYGISGRGNANAESYGAFGEWYASRWLTLRFKGGGYNGDADGAYAGGGLGLYLGRNLVLNGTYDYVTMNGAGHLSTAGTSLEFMPYQPWPFSTAIQYSRATQSGGGKSTDVIGFVLKFRLGQSDMDLRSWDRKGPTQWNGALAI
ncbi:MAG: hypothetical protein P4L57_00980 [Rhizomicrobium sp.]|nr:hypothetical protein [Rhizomicrobium sp.]